MPAEQTSTETTPRLNGVHHTAFATWKPKETVEFYRDIMGLKLVHAITAKGWGRDEHPDFLHFFFDAGNGSTIAFFYYIGTEPRPELTGPRGYVGMSRHSAWSVTSEADMHAWKQRLEDHGVRVSEIVGHEILQSIYFRDPNGYPLEITLQRRELADIDAEDARLTIEAMVETFGENPEGKTIEDMWRLKGEKVRTKFSEAAE